MAEYINRNLAKAEFTGNFRDEYPTALIHALIDQIPAADVKPVVHGENSNAFNALNVLKKAVEVYGPEAQTDMMIEEMAELTQALLKYRRYGTPLRLDAVLEEIADVRIMLAQMEIIYGDSWEWREKKLARLEARLSGQTEKAV